MKKKFVIKITFRTFAFVIKIINMPKIIGLSEKQDKDLVELLKGGSHEALGELYTRFKKRLVCACKKYTRNEADAEDIVHDIFLQIWENRLFLNPELSFSGYVQILVQNATLKKLRRLDVHSRFARNILMNETDSTNETENTIIDNDYAELLDELIEKLPPMQKKVFRLSRLEGYTYKEISELLQMPVGNVRRYASFALEKIKDHLIQHTGIHIQMIIIILMFFL